MYHRSQPPIQNTFEGNCERIIYIYIYILIGNIKDNIKTKGNSNAPKYQNCKQII